MILFLAAFSAIWGYAGLCGAEKESKAMD